MQECVHKQKLFGILHLKVQVNMFLSLANHERKDIKITERF